MSDEIETIDKNPKSWAAWKREAERLQEIIDCMALAAMDREPVAWTSEAALSDVACEETSMIGQEGVVGSIPLYLHAQRPVVPATLPCSVELKPGLIIGKGCKTETLLTALRRRADYNADIDAMTPEERAEHDASIKAFKAMLTAAPQLPGSEPAKVPGKWISVSERMPEDRTQVILWDAEIGEVTSGHYSHKTHTFYHCGDAIKNEITHWMPPPSAPQEGNS